MKYKTCDVCGRILTDGSPELLSYKSNVFGFDLCQKHKEVEHKLDMRRIYLNALRRESEDEDA